MSAYRCPSCGTSDPLGYVRCNQSSCPDGRDPRPQSGAEVDHLCAQVASLQKELAERTAGQERYKRSAAKHFADSCHLADRALTAEARADTLARRVEGLEAALSRIADPRNIHFAGDAQIVARNALAHSAALKQKDGGNG